mmetsp:Transcript_8116/g.17626  ORF Transcript_8116/g.17626 Transcript_8116/m.17626 type:complete len:309 (-) Transcript_8116:145-1071(-)
MSVCKCPFQPCEHVATCHCCAELVAVAKAVPCSSCELTFCEDCVNPHEETCEIAECTAQAGAEVEDPVTRAGTPGGTPPRKRTAPALEGTPPKVRRLHRVPSMCDVAGMPLLNERPAGDHRMTLVLDLDETIVYSREAAQTGVYKFRPGIARFLKDLRELSHAWEVIVWTAGISNYARDVLQQDFDGESLGAIASALVYRSPKWFDENAPNMSKPLKMLGRPMRSTLIVDNLPENLVRNPGNGVLVDDFEGCGSPDETLPKLGALLRQMAETKCSVPRFLDVSNLLQRRVQVVNGKRTYIRYLPRLSA